MCVRCPRVRRRRFAPLERRSRRDRSAAQDRGAARLRGDEGEGARLGAGEAVRSRSGAGARPAAPDARRRRLRRGARGLPGAEARVQSLAAPQRIDRPDDADRRWSVACGGRQGGRHVRQRGALDPRSRALRRAHRDRSRRARPRSAAGGAPARRRRPAALQRRPPGADSGAATAGDRSGRTRIAPAADPRRPRRPRPDAPQVRRA